MPGGNALGYQGTYPLSRGMCLDKALVACDELTGFIVAVALMRPSKSLSDLRPRRLKEDEVVRIR